MPPHPLNASLNHVISQGIENTKDAIATNDFEFAQIEIEHIGLVSEILGVYLLHGANAGNITERLNDYWYSYKPEYINKSSSKYVNKMYVSWKFLDVAIDAHNYEFKAS